MILPRVQTYLNSLYKVEGRGRSKCRESKMEGSGDGSRKVRSKFPPIWSFRASHSLSSQISE